MIKTLKSRASEFWMAVMTVGILGCLAGVAYTFYSSQQEVGKYGEYQPALDEMRLRSQQLVVDARESIEGGESTFASLSGNVEKFEMALKSLQGGALDYELKPIEARWAEIRESSKVLLETGSQVALASNTAAQLDTNIKPIQREFTQVVELLRDEGRSSGTSVAAQQTLWLSERIDRNLDRMLTGGADSQRATDEFLSDIASFSAAVEALRRGNSAMNVERVTNNDAISSIDKAAGLFSVVSRNADDIAGASDGLRRAAQARNSIEISGAALSDSIAVLIPAIGGGGRIDDRGSLMALFGAPGVLALVLLVLIYRGQRRRVEYTEQGVAEINRALVKIAEGDLTVQVPEENTITREIARGINASTERQRELIRNILTPFEVSVEGITTIGVTAEGQVEKGRELTRSVVESTNATTEMVRTSEEIKSSTAEAARTSERNRQRVAQGYELTKDMSKASADVRESVQETSKSAKRQGELIQSVTAAAEYIQALNTKISVVAINTRIEAEKAGEHGRPFLGIAEAIGDLLREAEEEGRKIISEVRLLQNLSADNLASMENTVGTVVTILEYIDRLDSSLEEINAGSSAITSIITSVDDAAGQSAHTAQHMNSSMDKIRERNLDISQYSESTQVGVGSLKASMYDVAESLRQFKIEQGRIKSGVLPEVTDMQTMQKATRIYHEEEMKALEESRETRASV